MKKHLIWIGIVSALIIVMGAASIFARSATFNPTVFTDAQTTGDFVANGAGTFRNVSATSLYGGVTGTVTGHASLDLPLTGGTMSGAIKHRAVPADVFTHMSTTGVYGPVTGNVTGNVYGNISGNITATSLTYTNHSFTTMTTTINGILRHILYY